MHRTSDPGPRLLAALGLDAEDLRRQVERLPPVEEDATAGLDYWVPTLASRPPGELADAPVPGGPDALDPRDPVAATPWGRHRRTGRRRDRRPAPVELPASVRGARWEAARPALVGLALVLDSVAAVLGLRIWAARVASEPRDVAPGVTSTSGLTATPAGVVARTREAFGAASPTLASTGRLRVHVVGRVQRQGVVVLPAGSRVEDAVRAAGGFAVGADRGAVNLARPVVDGEQVRIPTPGEVVAGPVVGGAGPTVSGSGGTATANAGGSIPVNLNTADATALDSLPGVGQVLAGRILAWRQEHGRFSTVEELGEVSGIGDTLLERLTPLVSL